MRTCENCGIKLPPYRSRTRHPESGLLVCDGCHPNKAGSEGRPVGLHGSKTAAANDCGFCGGPGVVVIAGQEQDCPDCGPEEVTASKTAADWGNWGEATPEGPKTTYRCLADWTDEATGCGPDHPCEVCGATSLRPRQGGLLSRAWDRLTGRTAGAAEGLEQDLVRSFQGREVPDSGETVVVYRDLSGAPKSGYPARESWSVKRQKSAEVVAHTQGLRITNVKPTFLEGARKQFQRQVERGVHAFLTGTVDDYVGIAPQGRALTYFPDISVFFFKDSRKEFLGAQAVTFLGGKCIVEGGQEGTEVMPRSRFEPCPTCGAAPKQACPHDAATVWGISFQALLRQAAAGLQVLAHDSGDGATIYHCPFCGAGQTVARSDGTTECGFCQTFFTVQVQPEHAAMPQTDPATGQPLAMPGMPGDPTSAEAPTPTPTETAAPAGTGDFAPAGSGGTEGFAPAGQGPVEQFAPAGSRAASRRSAASSDKAPLDVRSDDYGMTYAPGNESLPEVAEARRADWDSVPVTRVNLGSEPLHATEAMLKSYSINRVVSGGEGFRPGYYPWLVRTSKGLVVVDGHHRVAMHHALGKSVMEAKVLDLTKQATRTTPYYLTPDQVALPEPSYLAHLALRFAADREAVLQQVRTERAAR